MTTVPKIIGVCGRKRHGKDTVGQFLIDLNPHETFRTAFADTLKETAQSLYGLTYEQMYGSEEVKEAVLPRWGLSPRQILQRLGTDVARSIHPDTWIRATLDNIVQVDRPFKRLHDGKFSTYSAECRPSLWIITDVRFPNEADAIRAAGGFVVKVIRPGISSVDEHPSETQVDHVAADYTIMNEGTLDELRAQVVALRLV
jgi:hypothetical protein